MQPRTKRLTVISTLAAVLLICIVSISLVIAHSSSSTGGTVSVSDVGPEPVIFAPSISYTQALRLITDMGLQPSLQCPPQLGHYTPGSTLEPQAVWQPMGQRETFSQTHQIIVYPTFSAPLDWRLRIVKILGVRLGPINPLPCPQVIYGTPPPGLAMPLNGANSADGGVYVRITFSTSQTYDDALYTVSNLGLGLVDYCYEQAEIAAGRGTQPSWQFVGQEQQFAQSHTIIVKVEGQTTSTLWRAQLRSQSGVVSIEVPYASTC